MQIVFVISGQDISSISIIIIINHRFHDTDSFIIESLSIVNTGFLDLIYCRLFVNIISLFHFDDHSYD